MSNSATTNRGLDIAIVGMAGRFPQARSITQFWENLRDGKESISFFTDQELESRGVSSTVYRDPKYVRAGAVLEDIDLFDARFFGYSAREAEILDPQQRIFLECAWEALEDAGYDPDTYSGVIGVFGGVAMNRYMRNLFSNPEMVASVGLFQICLANDKDFLSTRVSYKLNLQGPAITVQSACSTSLVAVHMASQSLLSGECDMAVVGGVRAGEEVGYICHERGIASPDGHCRAFDARAQGTVAGNGVGIVVLKRMEDALGDGDTIHAILKGSAVNNDGGMKVGYTAPSVEAQAAVITAAHAVAGVDAQTVTYVEAHGTATELGDPIEVAALARAFGAGAQRNGYCAIGSVKTNIGHLDVAAGIAGLIKTVLALKHKMIPPSLHFTKANPKIDLASTPFYVNSTLSDWKTNGTPRRAGVSSFGVGGTNAHVVLEEAPQSQAVTKGRPAQLLVFSAKTASALEAMTGNLADYLNNHTDLNLADVAHTLRRGRKRFAHRRFLTCEDLSDAAKVLETRDAARLFTAFSETDQRPVAFMFPGLGDQYVNMAGGIYRTEATFRRELDYCSEVLGQLLGLDLRRVLFSESDPVRNTPGSARPTLDLKSMLRGSPSRLNGAEQELDQTFLAQPVIFAVEYALAQLWMSWGVRPQAMIGYSIGEYVAACLSEVFSLEDALSMVARRAEMIQRLPRGSMLAVPLPEAQVCAMLDERLTLAAVNGPSLCVVAGTAEGTDELAAELAKRGVVSRHLSTTHAFHSRMMEPISQPLIGLLETVSLNPPKIPFISNVTGRWIKAEEATSPGYWARHMCQPVRFADGIDQLWTESRLVLLEVGPGQSLGSLALLHPANDRSSDRIVLSSLPTLHDSQSDTQFLLTSLGKLWLAGVNIAWDRLCADEQRRRLPLPTYPFERQRYWVERREPASGIDTGSIVKQLDIADWLYIPSWRRAPLALRPPEAVHGHSRALVFTDGDSFGERLAQRLSKVGWEVLTVEAGESFAALSDSAYRINPAIGDDYQSLFRTLVQANHIPDLMVHCWNITSNSQVPLEFDHFSASQWRGFFSLVFIAQALGKQVIGRRLRLLALTNNMQEVTGQEHLHPEKATLLGPIKTIPQEYPNVDCRSIDIVLPEPESRDEQMMLDRLCNEVAASSSDAIVAYRGNHRWVQVFDRAVKDEGQLIQPPLRDGGVYLIIGGLGEIGLTLAQHLARTVNGRLVLTGRSGFPEKPHWGAWLDAHGEQDSTSLKIRKLQAVEELGGQVLILKADVAEEQEMREVIDRTFERFGALHGVIHAAGVVGERSFRSIAATGEVEYGWHVRPKVQGLLVLDKVLREHQIDFGILFSSLASLLGGLGFTAYTAASGFMDAFACKHNQTSKTPWISLDSDAWRSTTAPEDERAMGGAVGLGELSLTPEEGVDVFCRVLAMGHQGQVVVSTGELQARINRWIKLESLRQQKPDKKDEPSHYARPNLQSPYVGPTNETEKALVGVWQDLLGFAPISINDNFFELGGHSLLIVQMISRVRDLFRTEIPMEAVFRAPTVAGLASQVSGVFGGAADSQPPPIKRAGRKGHTPLSFAQQRLWFMDQLKPGNPAYNLENPVRLTGRLNVPSLGQTLSEIERRHESLRTIFSSDEGRPSQHVIPPGKMTLPVVDLSGLRGENRELIAKALSVEEATKSFDLARGPMWRATLLRLAAEEHLALFTMHHIVSDAWSMDVLFREVSTLYQDFGAGRASTLSELAIQYTDYAFWQREWLQGEALEPQLTYWKKRLEGSPPRLELPTDFPRNKVQTFRGASQSFTIPQEVTAALRAMISQQQVTLFMALLASFQVLLHRYTGQDEIVIGSPVANRNRAETESLIGFFVNPLVLRVNLSGNPTLAQVLMQVREVTIGAQAHQDLPFELLVDALQLERQPNISPLFQVVFSLDHIPKNREALLPGLRLEPFELETGTSQIDLLLSMVTDGEKLGGYVTYDSNLFEGRTIAEIIQSFTLFLAEASADPELRILDIPLRRTQKAPRGSAPAGSQAVASQFIF